MLTGQKNPVMSNERWDYVAELLGPPDSDAALQRSAELTAAGSELLGVNFKTGIWHFRRIRPVETSPPTNAEQDLSSPLRTRR
jgi:hypothetical protein